MLTGEERPCCCPELSESQRVKQRLQYCDETESPCAHTHSVIMCVCECVTRQVTSLTREASSLYSKTEVCCGNCYITPALGRSKTCCYERSVLWRRNTSQRPNTLLTLGQRANGLVKRKWTNGAQCTGYSGTDRLAETGLEGGDHGHSLTHICFFKWNMLYIKKQSMPLSVPECCWLSFVMSEWMMDVIDTPD